MSNLKLITIVMSAFLLSLFYYTRPDASSGENTIRPNIEAKETVSTPMLNKKMCLPLPSAIAVKRAPLKNCSLPYVVMFDGGRLGNQMCQYLSLNLLRKQYGIKIAIRTKMKNILTTHFENIWVPLNDSNCFNHHTKAILFNDLYRKLFAFSESNRRSYPLSESHFVRNYPCPLDLLLPWREKLKGVLVFKPEILEKARRQIRSALETAGIVMSSDITLITVHVRRTDYIEHMKSRYGLRPLTKDYFSRAFDYFRDRFPRPIFLVTTDDRKWCESHILAPDVLYAGTEKEPVVDIALLSQGNHTVVSFGTFGFVGAFLGRGLIVHPDNNPTYYCEDSKVTISVPAS